MQTIVRLVKSLLVEYPNTYGQVGNFVYHLPQSLIGLIGHHCIEAKFTDRLNSSNITLNTLRKEDSELFETLLTLRNVGDGPRLQHVEKTTIKQVSLSDSHYQEVLHHAEETMRYNGRIDSKDPLAKEYLDKLIEIKETLGSHRIGYVPSRDLEDFIFLLDDITTRLFEHIDLVLGDYRLYDVWSVTLKSGHVVIQYVGDYRILEWETDHLDEKGRYHENPIDFKTRYGLS